MCDDQVKQDEVEPVLGDNTFAFESSTGLAWFEAVELEKVFLER